MTIKDEYEKDLQKIKEILDGDDLRFNAWLDAYNKSMKSINDNYREEFYNRVTLFFQLVTTLRYLGDTIEMPLSIAVTCQNKKFKINQEVYDKQGESMIRLTLEEVKESKDDEA